MMMTIFYVLYSCQARWTCLCQCFSKEKQLWENETRNGTGKPTRQKWILFDNLKFLKKIVTPRRLIYKNYYFYLNISYKYISYNIYTYFCLYTYFIFMISGLLSLSIIHIILYTKKSIRVWSPIFCRKVCTKWNT